MFVRRKSYLEMFDNLNKFAIQQLGFGPVGEVRMLTNGADNSHLYFRDKVYEANLHTSVWQAEAAMVTQRNDVMLVTPEAHTWLGDAGATGTALTWDKQNTHMLGMDPGSLGGYQRVRFAHSGYAMANFMTVSGAANKFKNIRWGHGTSTGGAADITCLTVTGSGNVFERCNFGTPLDATQAASSNYLGMVVSGAQNYFKSCMFGTANQIDRNGTSCMLSLSGSGALNVFEDCLFLSHSTANAFFIKWSVTENSFCTTIFRNCAFINNHAAAEADMSYAISDTAHVNNIMFFDSRCTFVGVGDITNGTVTKIKFGGSDPNDNAVDDRLKLGLAQSPVA